MSVKGYGRAPGKRVNGKRGSGKDAGGRGEGNFGSTHSDEEAAMDFIVGTTPDGRVLLDFRGMTINHMKLDQDMALNLAEALCEAVRTAKDGCIIRVPGFQHGSV